MHAFSDVGSESSLTAVHRHGERVSDERTISGLRGVTCADHHENSGPIAPCVSTPFRFQIGDQGLWEQLAVCEVDQSVMWLHDNASQHPYCHEPGSINRRSNSTGDLHPQAGCLLKDMERSKDLWAAATAKEVEHSHKGENADPLAMQKA